MNAANGKDSTIILSIPYNYSDPDKGFLYQGKEISAQEYIRSMVESYNKYKKGIQPIQDAWDEVLGTNLALYNPRKENNRYSQQQYYFEETRVNIFDGDHKEMTIDMLIKHFQSKKPFVMIINMYRLGDEKHQDLLADMVQWARECNMIMSDPMLSTVEKLKVSSKKDMRIKFDDAKSSAILENVRMMEVLNNRTFTFLVERITFVTTT